MTQLTFPFVYSRPRALAALAVNLLVLGAGIVLGTAARFDPRAVLAAKAGLTFALAAMAYADRRTGFVPPALTLPLVAAALAVNGYRLWDAGDLAVAPFWIGILALWGLRAFGGGDAKLLLGLFGLYPDLRLLWLLAGLHIVVGVPLLVWKYRRTPICQILAGAGARLLAAQLTPTASDLEHGERTTWLLALAGGLYVWTLA